MDSKELRIGNYINFGSTVSEVFGITVTDVMFKYSTGNEEKYAKLINEGIQPVLLTEEWLIKFGFKNITLKYQENSVVIGLYLENIDSYLTFNNNEWRLEQDDDWRDGGNHHDLPNFEFVHQLQNLYFSLTGKELTLK